MRPIPAIPICEASVTQSKAFMDYDTRKITQMAQNYVHQNNTFGL
jgi:hypothetical protein